MPVRLDLLRHGVAEATHPEGDSARSLTPDGARAVAALGLGLGAAWRPERVLASPYRRAQETASAVIAAAGVSLPIERVSELEPESDPAEVELALEALLSGVSWALLVGHQPLLGRLVERWTGVPTAFAPAELARIEFPDSPGPKAGRRVARHPASG